MEGKSSFNNLTGRAIELEREHSRVKKLKESADISFRIDFRYENTWTNGGNPDSRHAPREDKGKKNRSSKGFSEMLEGNFKKLRNKLAKMVHPDKNGGDEALDSEFKEIQEAFEEGNLAKLIESADRYNVEVDLTESDEKALLKAIKFQEDYIKKVTTSLEWAWMYCPRSTSDRKEVWRIIGVDGLSFVNWLETIGFSLEKLEAECQARKKSEPSLRNYESHRPKRRAREKSSMVNSLKLPGPRKN